MLACGPKHAPSATDAELTYLDVGPDKPGVCLSKVPEAGKLPDKGTSWTAGVAALEEADLDAAEGHFAGDHPAHQAGAAVLALLQGQLETGRGSLRDLANAWPDDPCLQQAAGYAFLLAGRLDTGMGFVKSAVKLAPNEADNHLLDGVARFGRGDLDGAMKAWRTTLQLEPGNPLASAMLGDLAVSRGDAASAVPHLEAALAGGIDVSPKLAPAYFAAGQLGDYLRVASTAAWPLGDGGSLATADDTVAAYRELVGVTDGALPIELETSMGTLHCELFWEQTPVTVANFVGLARGTQPWIDPATGELGSGSYYAGTVFHRVIPEFMIQGGDRTGTGTGTPGYRFADEILPSVRFDRPGLLGMANNGANANGSQFFVTEEAVPHLDGRHTIFGACDEADLGVVKNIARVPIGAMDKPLEDVVLIGVHGPWD